MKIYTKNGDKGETNLLGGSKVKKDHVQLECYGTIDELNAFIGNIYDDPIKRKHRKTLQFIQNQLFNLGSNIAWDGNKNVSLPDFSNKNIIFLENEIDQLEEKLPKLTSFILPSGNTTASKCHIARTVCRRAERNIVKLSHEKKVNDIYLIYLNRLSDYLFMLARDILISNKSVEIKWQKDK